MELVTNTSHQHESHGKVTIVGICREYSVFDTETATGSIPGTWRVQYSTESGDTRTDTVDEFTAALDSESER